MGRAQSDSICLSLYHFVVVVCLFSVASFQHSRNDNVLSAKSDSDLMLCLQRYKGLRI